jgi:6-pyruvoyltetrahydropterin/6-carboxytetrahydropterin synthase
VATDTGWVMDFGDIKKAVQPTLDIIDHNYLNELGGLLYNPTSENLAWWLWERFSQKLPTLKRITVKETCTCGATYEGRK